MRTRKSDLPDRSRMTLPRAMTRLVSIVRHPRRVALVVALSLVVAATAASARQNRPQPGPSVARLWNEQLLAAIRIDIPKPPAHARNLFHLSISMWDAWAAYDPAAIGYLLREKHAARDVQATRREAISYAAYRLLKYRFPAGFFDQNGITCHPNA